MELMVNRDLKEPEEGEIIAEPRGRRTRATLVAWKPKVRPLTCGIEEEMGAWQTGAMIEEIRMTMKLEGRRQRSGGSRCTRRPGSPWQRLTETKPDGRGSPDREATGRAGELAAGVVQRSWTTPAETADPGD